MNGLKIRFDLAFDGGSWPGPLAEDRTAVVGEEWLGPRGLLGRLESALGLTGAYPTDVIRAAQLLPLLRTREGFWSQSFERDGLATALRLLRDRDSLVMHGWRGEGVSQRLSELAQAVEGAGAGFCDRLNAVAAALEYRGAGVDELLLHEPPAQLPRAWRRVLEGLAKHGTQITPQSLQPAAATGDLAAASASVVTDSPPPFTPEGDGSLQLLRAHGPLQAADDVAAWLAAQPSLNRTVIIGADDILDAALRSHGLPTTGSGGDATVLLALLPLIIEAGWHPADPAKIHELLTIHPSPIPRRIAHRLIGALQKWPAVSSDAWNQALADGLSSVDETRREKVEKRLELVFTKAAGTSESYPAAAVLERIDCVASWAAGYAHVDELDGAFRALSAQCETLQGIITASGQRKLSRAELRRWLAIAQEQAPLANTSAGQAGLASIKSPAAIVAPAEQIVWWGFTRDSAPRPSRLRLTTVERLALAEAGVELPDSGDEAVAIADRWRRPLLLTETRLILVCARTDQGGDPAYPHPLWDEIVSHAPTRRAAEPLINRRPVGDHIPSRIALSLQPLPTPILDWSTPAELPIRETESPSSLERLLGCSLRWALDYHTRLSSGIADGPPGVGPLLYGRLAHGALERVFTKWPITPDEAASSAAEFFDDEAPRLAASLFLPRHRTERADTRHRIVESARYVARILENSGAQIRGIEERFERQCGDFKIAGKSDLVLDTPNALIDYKWGKTQVPRLEKGTALQLAAYAYLCANENGFPSVGYFVLRTQELTMEPNSGLDAAAQCQHSVAEETWATALAAIGVRRDELKQRRLCSSAADGSESKNELVDGALKIASECDFCSFSSLCGRTFAK